MRSTVQTLYTKRMTIAQVSYINNICIVPKLSYMLQVSRLSKGSIEAIQVPILRLAKHKLGITRTLSNSVITHRNLGNCNALADHLLMKQISSLHARLITNGPEEILTKIRINQGLFQIGATEEDWYKRPSNICYNM